ncbi:MAG: response regulator [Nitrospira sp.]
MSSRRSQYILVIDDDPDIRQVLQDRLEFYGFSVETAEDGPSALHKLNSFTPHCIFLDLLLPGMDGIEVLHRIKAQDHSIPIIIVTAAVTPEVASATTAKTALAYLSKPFELPQLRQIIEQWVEQPSGSEDCL